MGTERFFQQLVYWGAWLIIPFLWEVCTGFFSGVLILVKCLKKEKRTLDYYPRVSILIPLYRSKATLDRCLQSLLKQDYPLECLEVLLINNGSEDGSYGIFTDFQAQHPELKIWWYSSEQGKSKALNKGIFGSTGKYVINIDSDGALDSAAVKNTVRRFECDSRISCMTGVVLIDPGLIRKTGNPALRMLQINECFEYAESFLVGRNFQSAAQSIYTLAGAFSCFRREALLKTQLYNAETLGEDTHMTFQIRNFAGGKTVLCEDAFLYVDPVESLDKLYTQRQRWQRAELEVASLFNGQHLGGLGDFITKPAMRRILSDHTLTFPRLIWFFAMIYLYFINYPLSLLIGANVLLYGAYVMNSFLYLGAAALYLETQKETRRYLLTHSYICLILPLYRFLVYWVRMAGTINSLTGESRWKTRTLSEEIRAAGRDASAEIKASLPFLGWLRKLVNQE